jgi:hypothetical protein
VKDDHRAVFFEYSNAISCSANHGILMDQALANERLGRYMLERGDVEKASLYFQEACTTYSKWGANAKVDHLTKEMEKLKVQIKPSISRSRSGAECSVRNRMKSLVAGHCFLLASPKSTQNVLDHFTAKEKSATDSYTKHPAKVFSRLDNLMCQRSTQ